MFPVCSAVSNGFRDRTNLGCDELMVDFLPAPR